MKNIILVVILFLVSLQAKDLQKVSIQFQWFDQFQFAGYYIAKEKGFYKEAGLDVTFKKYKYGISVVDEVTSKKATYGTGRSSLIIDKSNGADINILEAIFQASPFVLISKKSSNIKTIKDIKNKKIALTRAEETPSIFAMISSQGIHKNDIKIISSKNKMESLLNGDVDVMSGYSSNQVYILKEKNIGIRVFDPKDYGFDFYSDILFTSGDEIKNHKQRAINFSKATIKGWEYAFSHIDETIELILNKYNSQKKSKKALIYEANDLKKLAYYKTKTLGQIDKDKIQIIYDVYNVMGFVKNKIDLDEFILFHNDKKANNLTTKEKLYLDTHKVIKVCTNPDWRPIEFIKDGVRKGMSIDTLNIIKNRLNIKLQYIPTSSWSQSQEFLKERKCDILPSAIKTKKREKYANFTKPYRVFNLAIITKKDKPLVLNLKSIIDKTMSRKKGSGLISKLKTKYPKIDIKETKSFEKAFKEVDNGNVYFTIATLPILSYYKNRFNFDNLQIAGYTKMKYHISIAVRNDDDILLNILDKSLAKIDLDTHNRIYKKWVKQDIITKIDYKLVLKLIIIFILILLVGAYFLVKQNKLKKDIEAQKDKFLNIFNNSKDCVTILADGVLVDCNNSAIKTLGYKTKQDILNLSFEQTCAKYQPDGTLSVDKKKQMINLALKNGYHNFEWIEKRADKSELLSDVMLTDIGIHDGKHLIHAAWRDITEQKRLKDEILQINRTLEERVAKQVEAITSSEEQFKVIFESGLHSIAIVDLNSNFLLVNSACEKMLGMTKEELYKTSCIKMTTPKMRTYSRQIIKTVIEEGSYSGYEKQCTTNFGEVIDVKVDFTLLPNKKTILLFARDITQQNRDKKEKERLNKKMLQQSRLAQMGEMISMIAHQWRQPLNAISASSINLSMLSEMEILEDEKLQEASTFIQNQCQVMSKTINTFMNFVKPTKESKEFQISHMLDAIMEIMRAQLTNHNIKINIKERQNDISIVGHEDLLQQVIINLLANARDAFEERKQEEQFINITIEKRDNTPVIIVEDNAGGIPKEIHEKVFNPYFTTKEQGKGTGIGLYMSLDIMRKSFGGDLVLKPLEDGSRFEIVCGGRR